MLVVTVATEDAAIKNVLLGGHSALTPEMLDMFSKLYHYVSPPHVTYTLRVLHARGTWVSDTFRNS